MGKGSTRGTVNLAKYFGVAFAVANVFGGIYFLYFGYYERNKIVQTISEVKEIVQSVNDKNRHNKYQNFDTNSVAMTSLPYNVVPKETKGVYTIPNRFGGEMIFSEAVYNKDERMLYFALYDKQEQYKKLYTGVTAFVLLLTNLNRYECMQLAQVDWAAQIPAFMGMEPSYMSAKNPDNGIYNLSNYVLADNSDEKDINTLKTLDEGKVSKTPMPAQDALQNCKCLLSGCSIALKFYNQPYVFEQSEKKRDKRFINYKKTK
jgi:hypothetical protein